MCNRCIPQGVKGGIYHRVYKETYTRVYKEAYTGVYIGCVPWWVFQGVYLGCVPWWVSQGYIPQGVLGRRDTQGVPGGGYLRVYQEGDTHGCTRRGYPRVYMYLRVYIPRVYLRLRENKVVYTQGCTSVFGRIRRFIPSLSPSLGELGGFTPWVYTP